jgi:hypothetical protein
VTDIEVLDPSSPDYHKALAIAQPLAHPVTCIKKVNVPTRKQRFDAYVNHLSIKTVKDAFHGTPQVDWGMAIARNGPDMSAAGRSNGTALGSGFYTACNSTTSEGYATTAGALLLCKVAPGKTIKGDSSFTASKVRSQDVSTACIAPISHP